MADFIPDGGAIDRMLLETLITEDDIQQLSVELPGVPPYVKEAGGTPSMIKENVLK